MKLFLKIGLLSLALLLIIGIGFSFDTNHKDAQAESVPSNPIVQENQKVGSTKFLVPGLTQAPIPEDDDTATTTSSPQLAVANASTTTSTYTQPTINGYASAASINKGESINFYVSTTKPSYNIDIYRIGWYGGAGSSLKKTVSNLPGTFQQTPTPDPTTGLIDANWQVSYTLQTASDWTTGVYLADLTASDGSVGYIIFVVRDDAAPADILFQVPVTTYQAYNNWGGKSLYDYNSTNGRAYKVSYNRPYAQWDGAGDFFDGSYNTIRYLESQGYNISYATSIDTQTNPNLLNNKKVFLSDRHDEYWSTPMRDNLTSWRDEGKSLAFFDANNIFWQIRFESDSAGNPNRTQVCYKVAEGGVDPLESTNPELTTTHWRDDPVNKPENALLGNMWEAQFDYTTTYPWVVQNSSNWIYDGTNLHDGDSIPGVVGYEYDKVWNNGLTPANTTVLSNSPVSSPDVGSSVSNGTIYTAPSGAYVFDAGTIDWSWKLDDNAYQSHGVDSRIQQMTKNILNRMIGAIPTPTPTPTQISSPGYYQTVLGDSPLAYWRLGETSGTTLKDEENTYPGTYMNNPTLGQPGALVGDTNTSALFNGTTSYASSPYAAALNTSPFSVEAWVYPTGGAGTYRTVVASRAYPKGWVLYATGANTWSFWVNNGTGMNAIENTSVTLNTWTHVVATFDGTTAQLYINGSPVASGTTPSYSPNTTNPFMIGQVEPGGGFYFPGKIDEVSYYNKVLSPTQVLAHYQAGLSSGATPTPTPTVTATPTPTPTILPSATPSPTVNPTPTPMPTLQPTPTPTPSGQSLDIYTDALINGWTNGSYSSTISFTNTSPVYSGTKSIKFTAKAWGGLEFNAPANFNTTGYTAVRFAAEATQANQNFAVYAEDANFNSLGRVALSNYGGYPTTSWKVYTIPLGDILAANKTIGDITIQNNTGSAQPAIYVDQVQLVK